MISETVGEEKARQMKPSRRLPRGLKFPMPWNIRLPKTENFRTRYDTVLDQFTKLLMRSGKLTKAQKVLYSSPPSRKKKNIIYLLNNIHTTRTCHSSSTTYEPQAHQ